MTQVSFPLGKMPRQCAGVLRLSGTERGSIRKTE